MRYAEELNMTRFHHTEAYPSRQCWNYVSNDSKSELSSKLGCSSSSSTFGLVFLIILLQIGTSSTIPVSLISSQEDQSSRQDDRSLRNGAMSDSTSSVAPTNFHDGESDSNLTVIEKPDKTDDYMKSLIHVTSPVGPDRKLEHFSKGVSSIVKRASGSSKSARKLNSLMSFGQLIILAQEEAKCLFQFGSQKNKTGYGFWSSGPSSFEDGLYAPFTCPKGSPHFAQCDQCKNLTDHSRSPEECESYCAGELEEEPCKNLCFSINQAIADGERISKLKKFESYSEDNESIKSERLLFFNSTLPTSRMATLKTELTLKSSSTPLPPFLAEVDEKISSSATLRSVLPHFVYTPEIFCEGVDRVETTGKSQPKLSVPVEFPHQGLSSYEDPKDETEGKHFVVLKWDLNYDNLTESLRKEESGADDSRKSSGKNIEVLQMTFQGEKIKELPIVFVVEKYSKNSGAWETVGKTVLGLFSMNVAYLTDTYRWRITAVGPNGQIDQVTTKDYETLPGYVHPGPPKKIYVVQTTVNNSSVNVLIGWDPPKDRACFYRVILERPDYGKEINVRVNEPRGVHRLWFGNLSFGTQYSLLITSRDASYNQNSQSNLTRFDFTTPTCLESYNFSFNMCVPTRPRDVRSEIQVNSEEGKNVGVLLKWKHPQNTSSSNRIIKYVVTINRLNFKINGGSAAGGIPGLGNTVNSLPHSPDFNGTLFNPAKLRSLAFPSNTTLPSYELPGNRTSVLLKNLIPEAQYAVMITAYSVRGPSLPAEYHLFTRIGGKDEPYPVSGLWVFLTIPLCLVMLILVICHLGRNYLQKRKVKLARDQYFQSMEERDVMAGDWSIVPLTEETSTWKLFNDNFSKDRWEIQYENLIMAEVIGQGAFGVVRRAKIPRKKLQSSTLKFLDKSGKRSCIHHNADSDKDGEMETVAVKMLKVSATREDQEQLIKEIMTMQNLGFHSQIVGLIGACTKGRSLCLVLEYCPGGDLLTFIRKVRAKYWPTLGLSDARRSNSLSSIASKENTSSSITRSNGSCGSRGKHSTGEEPLDSSPINYADIEGFSDYSSNNEDHGDAPEACEQTKLCGERSPHRSPSRNSNTSNVNEDEEDYFRPIDEKDVLSYARQIAMGMDYLEKNRIVHRDLAGRNCLLMGDHRQVKISDFGLSRDIYTWNVYHQKSNGKLPIKWMAIESIFSHVFTTKSDVWSYGILLWELVTLGGTPYPGLGNNELFHLLKSGYRMERPDNCSEELYAVMKKCWRTSPAARPNFTELRHHVETMMEAAEPNLYLSLMADIPTDYFRLSSRSDLLQMNAETTDGSICGMERSKDGHYSGNSSVRQSYSRRHTKDYSTSSTRASHRNKVRNNFPHGNAYSSLNNQGVIESTNKYPDSISTSASMKPYTRSNSTATTSNSCGSSSNGLSRTNSVYGISHSDANATSSKFTLGAVPKRHKYGTSTSKSGRMSEEGPSSNGTLMEVSERLSSKEPEATSSQAEEEEESPKRKSALSSDSGMAVSSESGFRGGESCASSSVTGGECEGDFSVDKKDELDLKSQSKCQPVDIVDSKKDHRQYSSSSFGTQKKSISPGSYFGDSPSKTQIQSQFFPNSGSVCRSNSTSGSIKLSSPTSPSRMKQLPYPFKHVNDMTIIENKTYDLKD